MATSFVVIYEGDYLDPKALQATVNALGYCTELYGKTLFPKDAIYLNHRSWGGWYSPENFPNAL